MHNAGYHFKTIKNYQKTNYNILYHTQTTYKKYYIIYLYEIFYICKYILYICSKSYMKAINYDRFQPNNNLPLVPFFPPI